MGDPDGTSVNLGKRQKTVCTAKTDKKMNVYIWDMDETLILLKSLLNRTYAESFNGLKDVHKGMEIGKEWENYILQVCDEHFFYEQIEDHNNPSLDAFSWYDDGQDLSNYDFSNDSLTSPLDELSKKKLAYRHRVIAQKYLKGLQHIIDQRTMKSLDDLYKLTDTYTDSWLSAARALLEQCARGDEQSQNINILVTSGYLIPSLVKCMLFRLNDFIRPENVYSSWNVGKVQCFKWIKERFNSPNMRFCTIGDGWEEIEAAQAMRWPFVKIDFKQGSHFHKFPGLTLTTLGHYIDVVYERDGDIENAKYNTNTSSSLSTP
ncbi:protein-tyrosine-phosphatase [Ranunculus cassubicifolius]